MIILVIMYLCAGVASEELVMDPQNPGYYRSSRESFERDQDQDFLQFSVNPANESHVKAGRNVRQATGIQNCQTISRVCTNSPYRTYDGSCNNLNDPNIGASETTQKRLFWPDYCGGVEPRGCFRSFLPNPRDISALLHFDRPLTYPSISSILATFGQFLTHDVVNTPSSAQDCCQNPNLAECWSFPDNFHAERQCISFSQSRACSKNGVKEIINSVSSFIDCSQIYGSTQARASALRSGMKGCLLMSNIFPGFPPSVNQTAGLSSGGGPGQFAAGDNRINEMPDLVAVHTLSLREHNRIATELHRLTGWTDEKCYQEARRIVIAEIQNIVYNEYLPVVLGSNGMARFGLFLGDFCTTYNPNVDPRTSIEFSTCINRFGHSLVRQSIPLANPATKATIGSYSNSLEYFQHRQLTQRSGAGLDEAIAGLCQANAQFHDPYCVNALREDLFRGTNANFGSDLIARNIQRGRDHGLPGYNAFKQACGQPPVNAQRPSPEMDAEAWSHLIDAYPGNVDLIDCFTGLLHELPVPGAAVGTLGVHMQGEQYRRYRDGDRHFFTHCGNFNEAQRKALRGRTLGDIICQNSQQTSTQRNVFLLPSSSNPWIPCNSPSRSFLNLALFV